MRFLLILFFLIIALSSIAQENNSWSLDFCFNCNTVTKQHQKQLVNVIEKIQSSDVYMLKVFGYADTTGNEEYNDNLSKLRTENVFNYISSKVDLDSLDHYYTWLGESPYSYDLHFDKAKPQTRSVDIVLFLK